MASKKTGHWWWLLVPSLWGLGVFFMFTGGAILNPSFTSWIWKMGPDPQTGWLGWQFFRQTPLWQWPLGSMPNYGAGLNNSVLFADPVPLMALLFKPFSLWFPAEFQYFGIWVLLCCVLQAVFGWLLLHRVTRDPLAATVGSPLFAVASVYLWRLHGHFGLVSHWVLLAGIYLLIGPRHASRAWFVLLGLTVLIHPYLLAILLVIWVGDLVYRLWNRELNWFAVGRRVALALSGLVILMWATGYFMLPQGGYTTGGYGYYPLDLVALLDPVNASRWSLWLPDLPTAPYPGPNFLGLGIWVLVLLALAKLRMALPSLAHRRIRVMAGLALFFLLFSLTHRIYLGGHLLFTVPIPAELQQLLSVVRSSDRFFWPNQYLIYLAALSLLYRGYPRRVFFPLVLAVAAFQAVDVGAAAQYFRQLFTDQNPIATPLKSPVWSNLAQFYSRLVVLPPSEYTLSSSFLDLGYLASSNGMSINVGYFARNNQDALHKREQQLLGQLQQGTLPTDALYIFERKSLWNEALMQMRPNDRAGRMDGLYVLARGFAAACQTLTCPLQDAASLQKDAFGYQGERLIFSTGGNADQYTRLGWSIPEPQARWTDGTEANLTLHWSEPPPGNLELVLLATPFVTASHPVQRASFWINGQRLADHRFELGQPTTAISLPIPRKWVAKNNGKIDLRIQLPDAIFPEDAGLEGGGRQRLLGLSFFWLEVRQRQPNQDAASPGN